jgi:hypothetical protein
MGGEHQLDRRKDGECKHRIEHGKEAKPRPSGWVWPRLSQAERLEHGSAVKLRQVRLRAGEPVSGRLLAALKGCNHVFATRRDRAKEGRVGRGRRLQTQALQDWRLVGSLRLPRWLGLRCGIGCKAWRVGLPLWV